MNVLILGGDGFIGSHLRAAHILRGDKVVVIDKNAIRSDKNSNEYKFIKKDVSINDLIIHSTVRKEDIDLTYNCIAVATPSFYVKHPIKTFVLDFEVNKKILDFFVKNKLPIVHFSSSEVYGKKWTGEYIEDYTDLVIGPTHKQRWIYASSKILLEQYILASKGNCSIVRPFNFIGHDLDWIPGMNIHSDISKGWIPRVPSCFLGALFSNEHMKIVRPGTQMRCYTYIDDAIDGLLGITDNWFKCKGNVLNVGNPENEVTIEQLSSTMRATWKRLTGIEPKQPIYVDGEELYGKGYEDSERRAFSNKKMLDLTGWKAKINHIDTITYTVKKAIEEYGENFSIRCK